MGINATIVVIRGASIGDLEQLGLVVGSPFLPEGRTGNWLGAVPFDGGVAVIDWSLEDTVLSLVGSWASQLGREVVMAGFCSIADGYAWEVHDGNGSVRSWSQVEGQDDCNTGTPVPEEALIGQLDEDSLQDLLAARTGFTLDWDTPIYELKPPARRGLLSRLFHHQAKEARHG